MKRRFGINALTVILVGSTAASPGQLAAQEPDTVVADTSKLPVYRLEGLTVTITRSTEQIHRLPYAVGLLGPAGIQGFEPTISLDEALPVIPGVMVNNRYNFALGNRISIRGFGSRSQFGVRGIRVIQDGIPLTLPDGQAQLNNVDLGAAGRIEVIRGPASSLYGNAAGGVLAIETENPPSTTFAPELRVVGGAFGNDRYYQKYDLQAGGRLGGFDYVTHLGHLQSDGYRLHSAAEYTLFNTRIRQRLDDRSRLTAVANYVNAPQAQNPSTLRDSLARLNPDTARDLALSPAECPADPAFGGCQNLGESSKQGQAGITYQRLLGNDQRISLMAYGLFRELNNPIPFTLIELSRRAGGGRFEYRYAPSAARLQALTLGIDIDQQRDDRQEFERDDVGVGDLTLDQDERVTSFGLFAHSRWLLSRTLELTLGLRYDRIRFNVDDRFITADDPDDSGNITLEPDSDVFGPLSPMVGLSYAYAPWLNLYVNIGSAFQTPTTTELTDTLGGFNASLKPEQAISRELGLKGTIEGRISYSLALFQADIDDQLIGFQAAVSERDFFVNAGSSTHTGLEAGISALLMPGLTLSSAYTYSDFNFDSFSTDDGDFSGNAVPGIPPHQFHSRLNYTHRSGFTGAAEVTAVEGFYVDNANETRNDGYVVFDLRLGYRGGLSDFGIEPFLGVNNLFDVRYNSSVVINAFGGRFFEPAPGRNVFFGLRLSLD